MRTLDRADLHVAPRHNRYWYWCIIVEAGRTEEVSRFWHKLQRREYKHMSQPEEPWLSVKAWPSTHSENEVLRQTGIKSWFTMTGASWAFCNVRMETVVSTAERHGVLLQSRSFYQCCCQVQRHLKYFLLGIICGVAVREVDGHNQMSEGSDGLWTVFVLSHCSLRQLW